MKSLHVLLFALLLAYMNARFDGLRSEMNERFESINHRFESINQRFDDMRDLWRAELHRVEEILDMRLKYLEGRRG